MASTSSAALDSNEVLEQEWTVFGKPEGYEAPCEKERRDLTDSRHRKRGEQAQRKRLKRNRQQLERERDRERATELGGQGLALSFICGQESLALPTYLLDRCAAPAADAESANPDEDTISEYSSDDEGRPERKIDRRLPGFIAREDARWANEQKERRAREAREWDAAGSG